MTPRGSIDVSLAAPAFNEEEVIATSVREWAGFLAADPRIADWEIVVCDDGSTDGTARILDGLQHSVPELRVVRLSSNQGAGAAIATALRNTQLDWVLLTDSDGQFPIDNLGLMVDALHTTPGAAAMFGARRSKSDDLAHRAGSRLSSVVANRLHQSRCRDFNSVFKLVDGPLFRSLPLESTGMSCSTEITSQLLERGIDWVEVPIDHTARSDGARSYRLVRAAVDRAAFLGYLGLRQALIRRGIIRRPDVPGRRP